MSAVHPHTAPEPDEEPGEPAPAADPPGRGIATMPNLRPYYDVRQLADLAPLGVAAGRGLARAAGRALRVLARGGRILGGLLAAWLSGRIGQKGSALTRILAALAGVYVVIRLAVSHPAGPWVAAGGLLVVASLAGLNRLPGLGAAASPPPAEPALGRQRGGLIARFTSRRRATPEECPAAPPEAPSEPPLTALIRELIGDDNGVHLAALRPAMRERLTGLAGASDGALRDALVKAGFDPSKTFRAGGIAGRAGVHRSQLPPLSPKIGPQPLSAPGDRPRPADSPRPESGGEPPESGRRYVRAPELGPDAWRIEHDGR